MYIFCTNNQYLTIYNDSSYTFYHSLWLSVCVDYFKHNRINKYLYYKSYIWNEQEQCKYKTKTQSSHHKNHCVLNAKELYKQLFVFSTNKCMLTFAYTMHIWRVHVVSCICWHCLSCGTTCTRCVFSTCTPKCISIVD